MRIKCPHCGSAARIRTSRPMSSLTIEHSLQCQNIDCAHTWVAHTSAVRTIAPSMTPNPRVFIPLSPRSHAKQDAQTNQITLALDEPPHPRAMAIHDTG